MELMDKKTILVFVDWYVPGFKAGGPIKSIYSMVYYLKKDFNFLIITTNTDFNDPKPYAQVTSNQWNQVEDGVKVFYASTAYLTKRNIYRFLSLLAYDVVYLNSMFSLYFSIYPLLFYKAGVFKKKIILAPRGMLGEGALKIKRHKKILFLNAFKLLKLHNKITWHLTSEQEKEESVKMFGKDATLFVVPNLQISNWQNLQHFPEKKEDEIKLFFLSRISRKKNILFALKVLLNISLPAGKRLIFDIYGPIEDNAYWKECMAVMERLNQKGYTVTYKGAVKSELVPSVIENYHFLFLPTLNENYGHAIVESFMNGKPVIISNQTPWTGLEVHQAGWDIGLDNSAKFESVIEKCVVMGNNAYKAMAQASIEYAKKNCDSGKDALAMKSMFENVIADE